MDRITYTKRLGNAEITCIVESDTAIPTQEKEQILARIVALVESPPTQTPPLTPMSFQGNPRPNPGFMYCDSANGKGSAQFNRYPSLASFTGEPDFHRASAPIVRNDPVTG